MNISLFKDQKKMQIIWIKSKQKRNIDFLIKKRTTAEIRKKNNQFQKVMSKREKIKRERKIIIILIRLKIFKTK